MQRLRWPSLCAPSEWHTATLAAAASPLRQPSRGLAIGGRKARPGASIPTGKTPLVKRGPALGVPRRVPGTTKVRYTNDKGRTFSFSIPVTQLTHPPTIREGASPQGWRHIDTSYADTGDLEEDMPSPVQEFLRKRTVSGNGEVQAGTDEEPGLYVQLDMEDLLELQRHFVEFCRQYVLMDTQGMKASLSYGELNNGPDYEMYDRKSMRKRYWLAIRHQYEDVKELLWPSSVLEVTSAVREGVVDSAEPTTPTLPPAEMLEALVWLEAASTFCVRSHRPYDLAGPEEFLPLELSREVRVLAVAASSLATSGDNFFSAAPTSLSKPEEVERALSDRFISCASLCSKYNVPLAAFLKAPHNNGETERATNESGRQTGTSVDIMLLNMPALRSTRDAIRFMSIMGTALEDASVRRSTSTTGADLCFTDVRTGRVVSPQLAVALSALCGPRLFGSSDALENVAESELCAVMRFLVLVRERNAAFFEADFSQPEDEAALRCRDSLQAFTRLVLARCRHLLYRLGGPQTTVMSGDDEYVPFVEMQRNAERSHPQALVHYKIGLENAMGLRFARLRAGASTTLVGLLDRLEGTGAAVGVRTLMTDLVQHVAQKAATGKDNLALADIIRVLPLLGRLRDVDTSTTWPNQPHTAEDSFQTRYGRLLSAIGTAIGAAMQQGSVTATDLVLLLEGLAACRHVPSSYAQVEAVLLRHALLHKMSLTEMHRCLHAMARLVGPRNVSQGVMQAAAAMVMEAGQQWKERRDTAVETPKVADADASLVQALDLARLLYRCHYGAFPSLVQALLLKQGVLGVGQKGDVMPAPRILAVASVLSAFAAGTMTEADPACSELSRSARHLLETTLLALDGTDVVVDTDLLTDVLTSCAAVGVAVSKEQLAKMEHQCADGQAWSQEPARTMIHSLCTPLLAVSVLESLEALSLGTESTLYSAAKAYVQQSMEQLDKVYHRGQAGRDLLRDDAELTVRVLYVDTMDAETKNTAVAILEREVVQLDAALEAGLVDSTRSTQESFEAKSLKQREMVACTEEVLLRYCAAIERVRPSETRAQSSA